MEEILKVLVGSRAHGLAEEDSDYDYRGVFVTPTSELMRLGPGGYKGNHWVEGEKEDNTSYELAHFLHLATKCNPSILEVFAGPVVESTKLGEELKELFPYAWNSKGVLAAFDGYSLNQRKKMLDDKYPFRDRKWKYAVAYARTLVQGAYLIRTGTMLTKIPDQWLPELRRMREGKMSIGTVMDFCGGLKVTLMEAYEENPNKTTDMEPIQEFLLKVRREHWDE